MKINYISNLPLSEVSGGWSGINYRIHNELLKYFDIEYIGPVNPPSIAFEKSISKISRIAGLKGSFHFFSERRLQKVDSHISSHYKDADYNFFFGQTPWIGYTSLLPYGTYMDAAFPTYMEIYSDSNKFLKKDLLRIQKKEEKWLQKAKHIFMGSQWAWNEMLKHYDLDEKQKVLVWVGGNIEIPEKDTYNGGKNLLFISLDFIKKGGLVAVEVLKNLREQSPEFSLTIVGQKPPEEVLQVEGIYYAGLLRKHIPDEYSKFVQLLTNAYLLIHPTKMDTMGAVIIEAGYYGCPAIASRSFGIPELIMEGDTGFLIDNPYDHDAISTLIERLDSHPEPYKAMRLNVKSFTSEQKNYNSIGQLISKAINNENYHI